MVGVVKFDSVLLIVFVDMIFGEIGVFIMMLIVVVFVVGNLFVNMIFIFWLMFFMVY